MRQKLRWASTFMKTREIWISLKTSLYLKMKIPESVYNQKSQLLA